VKRKKKTSHHREKRKKNKKNKETQKNALVYPIAERVHQVAPESGDATEQRSVSRSDFGRLRGGGGLFFFFFAASAHDDDFV
jgi:4-diphosphocytidyl-2C-methyl-D-erythritol kinase